MSSTLNSSAQIPPTTCSSTTVEEFMKNLLPTLTNRRPTSSSSPATIIMQPPSFQPSSIELPATSFATSHEQQEQFRKMLSMATLANTTSIVNSSISPASSSPSSSSAASIGTVQAQPPNGSMHEFCPINMLRSSEVFKKLIKNVGQQNHCQQNAFQQHLQWEEEERQRQKQAMYFNKQISHEKRKFTQPISDFMVKEVLKRKSHLVEHNTSRDLKFSEEKRKAWEAVRDLLKQKFAGFNMGIENIKSHWRYRKRKVSDAANEMRGPNAEEKLREKLGNDVDFDIYLELKASNMLDNYDDESPPMPLSNGDEIGNAMLFQNGGGILNDGTSAAAHSRPFPLLFDGAGQSHQHQEEPQQNGTMAQNEMMAQLLQNATAAGLPHSFINFHLFGGQIQNLLKARQQGEMTDSGANFNGNQPNSAEIINNGEELLEPLNAPALLNGGQLEGRDGRKRAADMNAGELFQMTNGISNGQYKARKEENEQQENGDSDEAENIEEEMAMECSMDKKGEHHLATSTSNGGNGMVDLWGQFNTLIQVQIAAAKSQKEAADLQKVAFAELLQAGKSINELLPKVDAIMDKWMEDGGKN